MKDQTMTTITRPMFLVAIQPEGKIARECLTEHQANAWLEQFNRISEETDSDNRAEIIPATATIVADRPIAAAK